MVVRCGSGVGERARGDSSERMRRRFEGGQQRPSAAGGGSKGAGRGVSYWATVIVVFMPASECPAMVQRTLYVPGLRSTVTSFVEPGGMASKSTLVPSMTKLCSIVPSFLMSSFTLPGFIVELANWMVHSFSETATADPSGVPLG